MQSEMMAHCNGGTRYEHKFHGHLRPRAEPPKANPRRWSRYKTWLGRDLSPHRDDAVQKRLTSFLVLLREVVIECIVGAIGTFGDREYR